MQLTVIAGRGGSGKTYRVYSEIGEAIEAGEKSQLLLVPELFTYNAEKDLIKQLGKLGIMSAQVLSPSRLQTRIFEETGGRTAQRPDKQTRAMIVRACIDRREKDLEIYAKILHTPEFAEQIMKQIREMKGSDITPEAIQKATDSMPDSVLRRKLKALHAVYEEYERFTAGEFLDMESGTDKLIEQIDKSEYICQTRVWVDGFDMFGRKNIRLLEALVRRAQSVTVTLTCCKEGDADARAFAAQTEAKHQLEEMAKRIKAGYRYFYMEENHPFHPEIAYLEKKLYAYGKNEVYAADNKIENIEIHAAKNPTEECELALLMIKKLVAEGYQYADIAVVCNALEEYEPLLTQRFSRSGIPFFLDTKRNVGGHPVVEMLTAAFAAAERGYERTEIMRYLRSGMVTDADVNTLGRFDNYCRKYGIAYKGFTSPMTKGKECAEMEKIRLENLSSLIRFVNSVNAEKTVEGLCGAVRTLLEENRVEERMKAFAEAMQKRVDGGTDNGYLRSEIECTKQIYEKLLTMTQAEKIMAGRTMKPHDFFSMTEAALMSYEIGSLPFSAQSVVVGNIKRTENSNIKAMIWMAMNAEFLPVQPGKDGMFSEEERDEMKKLEIEKEPDRSTEQALARFDIYSTACKATEKLIFTYAKADADGRERNISPVLSRVKRLFGTRNPEKPEEISDMPEIKDGEELVLYDREVAFDRMLSGRIHKPELEKGLKEYFGEKEAYAPRMNACREAKECTNAAVNLEPETVKELYGTGCLSVSKLEDYDGCPYEFFLKYGLGAEETEEAEPENSDVGSIFHRAMKQYLDSVNLAKLTEKESERIAGKAFDDSVKYHRENLMNEDVVLRAHSERMKRQFVTAAWRSVENIRKAEFRPVATEQAFGPNKKIRELILTGEDGTVLKLQGKIDRVDKYADAEGNTYYAVTDYKSGMVDEKKKEIEQGRDLQAVMYLRAVREGMNGEAGYCLYQSLKTPVKKADEKVTPNIRGIVTGNGNAQTFARSKDNIYSQEDFETIEKKTTEICLELYRKIRKGDIEISPRKTGEREEDRKCNFCQYKGICRWDEEFSGNTERKD